MSWKWIEYSYPVQFIFNASMVWANTALECYIAYSADAGLTWSYLKANSGTHTLTDDRYLLEATDEADAQDNFWNTAITVDGQMAKAKWPYMRQATKVRIYFQTTPCVIYELKNFVYVIADEIDAGTLHLAYGLTIASTEDNENAVKLDQTGLTVYGSNVKTVWLKNNGEFFFGNPSGANSLTFIGGILTLEGSMIITQATGYNNISDKPTTLANINATEGSKLGTIEHGADVTATHTSADTSLVNGVPAATVQLGGVRANIGLDVYGFLQTAARPQQPATPAGSGLFLGSDYLGFYDGSVWKSYIDNTGKFRFLGTATNYIQWDGSTLYIRGTLVAEDIKTGYLAAGRLDANTAYITGSAQIANAVINNAHINSLSADKITAGTINADVINVNNLNANNILKGVVPSTVSGIAWMPAGYWQLGYYQWDTKGGWQWIVVSTGSTIFTDHVNGEASGGYNWYWQTGFLYTGGWSGCMSGKIRIPVNATVLRMVALASASYNVNTYFRFKVAGINSNQVGPYLSTLWTGEMALDCNAYGIPAGNQNIIVEAYLGASGSASIIGYLIWWSTY